MTWSVAEFNWVRDPDLPCGRDNRLGAQSLHPLIFFLWISLCFWAGKRWLLNWTPELEFDGTFMEWDMWIHQSLYMCTHVCAHTTDYMYVCMCARVYGHICIDRYRYTDIYPFPMRETWGKNRKARKPDLNKRHWSVKYTRALAPDIGMVEGPLFSVKEKTGLLYTQLWYL